MVSIKASKITLDGEIVAFNEGETIYEIAQRHERTIPTLCYDPRLEAFGGCRLCMVEIGDIRNPVASCTTKAMPGMMVHTVTESIKKHRKVLLEMVASENPDIAVDPLRGYASQELSTLLDEYRADTGRFQGRQSGRSHVEDENPFILRDYDRCISCYRCVRVCAEQEGDHAISIRGRGFNTQITTEFSGTLKESSCTFCGQCVQTCPTGALADKKAMRAETVPGVIKKTRTVCPYCGVGCSVDLLTKGDRLVGVQPAMDGPANQGALCIKGQFAFDFVQHPDRLKTPMVRRDDGKLHEATWEEALDRAADGFRRVLEKHGRRSIYGVASGRTPSEADYMMQKFIRAGFGTHQIDNCSRA
ncbi:MAG: putative formate dehydrogenase [Verrucomicrobia subdivision 3 bacterium]|nr:putative formate dehydrogenase [Limisphaerales bacterium]MCS1415763.1 putative formate dehydrogenase [Limisphaerales bacterium]